MNWIRSNWTLVAGIVGISGVLLLLFFGFPTKRRVPPGVETFGAGYIKFSDTTFENAQYPPCVEPRARVVDGYTCVDEQGQVWECVRGNLNREEKPSAQTTGDRSPVVTGNGNSVVVK
jgi:hypothetical protein